MKKSILAMSLLALSSLVSADIVHTSTAGDEFSVLDSGVIYDNTNGRHWLRLDALIDNGDYYTTPGGAIVDGIEFGIARKSDWLEMANTFFNTNFIIPSLGDGLVDNSYYAAGDYLAQNAGSPQQAYREIFGGDFVHPSTPGSYGTIAFVYDNDLEKLHYGYVHAVNCRVNMDCVMGLDYGTNAGHTVASFFSDQTRPIYLVSDGMYFDENFNISPSFISQDNIGVANIPVNLGVLSLVAIGMAFRRGVTA